MSQPGKRLLGDLTAAAGPSRRVKVDHPNHSQARKIALQRALSTVDEEVEDVIGTESQKIRQLVKATTNMKDSDEFATNFRAKVEQDKKEVQSYVESKMMKAIESEAEFQQQIKKTLLPFNLSSSSTTSHLRQGQASEIASVKKLPGAVPASLVQASTQDGFSSLLSAGLHIIARSRDTIDEYKRLCKIVHKPGEADLDKLMETWKDDKKETTRLLEDGRKLSVRRIEKLIQDGAKTGKNAEGEPGLEISSNEASRYFKSTSPGDKRLQDTLHGAKRGVQRIVKELPREEL